MSEILVLQRVHARDAAGPRGKARGAVVEATLSLGPGLHAVLGAPEDGTLALLDAVTGRRSPTRGRVRVAGRDPARWAAVRARIGALGAEPELPPARSVGAAVRLAMRARGEAGDRFDAVIDPLGLSGLHARSVRSLGFAEARAVELALALSTPGALLLALHEPLADVAVPVHELVAQRLRELAAHGVCVLVTTSSPRDARALADHVFVLHRGLFVRHAEGGDALAQDEVVELTAWVRAPEGEGPGARELAAALARSPELTAVSWDESAAPEGTSLPGASAVRVRGNDAEACALALTEAALETGALVEAIAPTAPLLGEVRATSAALLKLRPAPRPAPAALAAPPAEVAAPPDPGGSP